MSTTPAKHHEPAPRESEALFQRALLRVRAAKDTLRDDPRRLTPEGRIVTPLSTTLKPQ